MAVGIGRVEFSLKPIGLGWPWVKTTGLDSNASALPVLARADDSFNEKELRRFWSVLYVQSRNAERLLSINGGFV